ncbi:MAG: hypothetical protein ACR2OC_10540 [Solirubrobacterales bacterium]
MADGVGTARGFRHRDRRRKAWALEADEGGQQSEHADGEDLARHIRRTFIRWLRVRAAVRADAATVRNRRPACTATT